MEFDYTLIGLIISVAINAYLFFLVKAMQSREKFVLHTTQEMIELSTIYSQELQQLKSDTGGETKC